MCDFFSIVVPTYLISDPYFIKVFSAKYVKAVATSQV